MTDIIEYKAGSLICFSEGEYSDYGYNGHFVVLQHMTVEDMTKCAAIASKINTNPYYCGSPSSSAKDGMIPQLIRAGFLLSINVEVIYLGAYGSISSQFGEYSSDIDYDLLMK